MANTITNYYTFVAGTKALAERVNENFSNHRGDLIPINTDTATASDGVHDIGINSHRFKDLKISGDVDIQGVTSVTSVILSADQNTTGAARVLIGSDVAMVRNGARPTSSSNIGGYAKSGLINTAVSTSANIANSTITVSISGRRPLHVSLVPSYQDTNSAAAAEIVYTSTIATKQLKFDFRLAFDGTVGGSTAFLTSVGAALLKEFPLATAATQIFKEAVSYDFVFFETANTETTYTINLNMRTYNSNTSMFIQNYRLVAWEH